MTRRSLLLLLTFILVFQMLFIAPALAWEYSEYLENIFDLAKERYYKDVTDQQLLEGALKGIFSTMDEYTEFYSIDEYNSFVDRMSGNYHGIGVTIMEAPDGVIVVDVFKNSPAEGAGILPNDLIIKIDGTDIKDYTADEVASMIKGAPGTFVELVVVRETLTDNITIKVQRNVVNISPVSWKVDGDVMYIKLESFSGNSARYFEQALKEMDKKGIWKMIIDLRDNLGGDVFQAVSIARHLIRKGTITKLDFKSEQAKDIEYLSYLPKAKYLPAVLVNGKSASASEILASAIQDSRDGFLVGTKTYGKGVVQNLYPILSPEAYEKYSREYGWGIIDAYDWENRFRVEVPQSELIGWLKITTGHYLTRAGNMIDGVGITPDFEVDDYEPVNGIDVHAVGTLESVETITVNGVSNDVYNAERILKLKGYDIASVDNVLNEETYEILKQYQKDNGIEVTGVLDEMTKSVLNKDLISLRRTIDRQYGKAMELLGLLKLSEPPV